MSIADLWDRVFWSIMVIIGVGLFWLRFVEPYGLACVGPGLVVALAAGAFYLVIGLRAMRRRAQVGALPGTHPSAGGLPEAGEQGHA